MVAFLNRIDSGRTAGMSSRKLSRAGNFQFMGVNRLCGRMSTVDEKQEAERGRKNIKTGFTANEKFLSAGKRSDLGGWVGTEVDRVLVGNEAPVSSGRCGSTTIKCGFTEIGVTKFEVAHSK